MASSTVLAGASEFRPSGETNSIGSELFTMSGSNPFRTSDYFKDKPSQQQTLQSNYYKSLTSGPTRKQGLGAETIKEESAHNSAENSRKLISREELTLEQN